VTTHTGTLAEVINGQSVVVAGMVQRARRHITKKGDEMAFVTLEDLHGTCDVIVFPRTWEQTKHLWQPERILVVGAKVDAGRRDEPSLLCNWVKTPDEVTVPSEPSRAQQQTPPPPSARQRPPASLPRTVRVTLTRGKEQSQDVKRLHQVHSLMVEYSGRDRFIIQVMGGSNGPVELAFPNNTTHYCPELTQKLTAIVGAGAVRVEQGAR
jgi:DNA polymerase-3 subunit alpha